MVLEPSEESNVGLQSAECARGIDAEEETDGADVLVVVIGRVLEAGRTC